MSEIRVLLVSPVRGVDPLSGDVTYTEQLLAAPPPGVRYTTYVEAVGNGTLVEHGSRAALHSAASRPRELAFALWRKGEYLTRRSGLAFREPLRILEVTPGAFDLVHVHVFHTRFLGEAPPVVMSAGGPLRWVYANAWGWPEWRLRIAESVDRAVGLAWDATICGQRRGRSARTITLSDDFRDWLIARGWDADRIDVAPNYLARPGVSQGPDPRGDAPRRLGFIAKDFDAKGGPEVLRAFRQLRSTHPALELVIVGSPPRMSGQQAADQGIRWLPLVPRPELLSTVLGLIDILLYPSHFDTSVPYGPMEALAAGIPCVVSDHRSLPELVGNEAGLVVPVGDVTAMVTAVETLLVRSRWEAASRAARTRFHQRFSSETQAPALGKAYRAALAPTDRSP